MQNTYKTELNNTLNALIAQRELWEYGTYKQANTELYAILEQCGEMFAALREDKKNARAFNAIAEEQGIAFNKGTSLALKIVRVVFDAQTNREFAYARVIKVWFDERTDEQTLTNYVIEHGGVENVRRTASNNAKTKLSADDYRDIAEDALVSAHALATLDVQGYMLSDAENDSDYVVALVRCDNDGNGEVVYGSNKRALVNNALAVAGKELDSLQEQAESEDTLEDVKQKKAKNMKLFLEHALKTKIVA